MQNTSKHVQNLLNLDYLMANVCKNLIKFELAKLQGVLYIIRSTRKYLDFLSFPVCDEFIAQKTFSWRLENLSWNVYSCAVEWNYAAPVLDVEVFNEHMTAFEFVGV